MLSPDGRTALAHARLSILDLSDAGAQPLRSELNGDLIVFNGEIYNFQELRAELRHQHGLAFQTDTDTEVLLKGWMIWRETLFARLNGMWSLVIHERATGALVVSRDRLGVKPLYVFRDADVIAFASEIGALRALAGDLRPNAEAVHDFLMFGVTDHRRQTFFQNIETFAAGAWAIVEPDGRMRMRSYHDWPERGDAPVAAETVRELVEHSVGLRLRSDAPTVSLLSSGLDSSIVTMCSARAAPREARSRYLGAFTYASAAAEAGGQGEQAEAARFFDGLGSPFRHLSASFDSAFSEAEMFDLIAALEEPLCNPSVIAAWRTYDRLSRQGVRVVLHGEGADEVFGGYPRIFCAWVAADALRRGDPRPATRALLSGAASAAGLAARLVHQAPFAAVDALFLSHRNRAGVFQRDFLRRHRDRRAQEYASRAATAGDEMTRMVLSSNLPGLLRYTDRASMRFGVEVRLPFLDYRVVEAGLAAPSRQLADASQTKILLREAFAGVLPEDVRSRRKYAGFGVAEEASFAKTHWERVWDEAPDWTREFIDRDAVRGAIASGEANFAVWNALSVLIWACVACEFRFNPATYSDAKPAGIPI